MRRAGRAAVDRDRRPRRRSCCSAPARKTCCGRSRSRSPARSCSGSCSSLLVDHDGPVDRRDWLAIGAGRARADVLGRGGHDGDRRRDRRACSGARGGSRRCTPCRSAPCTAPGGCGTRTASTRSAARPARSSTGASPVPTGVFGALGSVRGLGWVLARGARRRAACSRCARRVSARSAGGWRCPTALLLGAAAFLLIAAFDRSGVGASAAKLSRYLHILAALVLPAIAVAIDALLRRSRVVGRAGAGRLLVAGIPGNVARARRTTRTRSGRSTTPPGRRMLVDRAHATRT